MAQVQHKNNKGHLLGALGTGKRGSTRLKPIGEAKKSRRTELAGTPDHPAQQAATPAPSATTAAPEIEQDIDMVLPGTAQGQGGSGDGNSNACMEVYAPERPLSLFGSKISTYKKVHRFLTFGIANTWINVDLTTPTESQRWMTTALAEVPWQFPFLYLNQSEFDLIPPGSKVKEVRVAIYHRGNRIAFETASTATSLATLNQIQNIHVAHGLNKTGWGTNSTYPTFVAGEPMLPASVGAPLYATYPTNMYGSASATINTSIANHQIGFKMPLLNYWNIVTSSQQFGGTPPIAENIQFFDGKTTINQCVGEFKWVPKMAPLKIPLKHLRTGLPRDPVTVADAPLQVHTNGSLQNTFTASLSGTASAGGSNTTVGQVSNNIVNNFSNANFTMFDLIEKSQHIKSGPWGQFQKPQIQPDIHIGIQAIPSLSTANIYSPITSWTDSQADWEVFAEMDVEEHQPTKLPFATVANVPAGDVMYRTQQGFPEDNTCSYAGLYPNNSIRV